MTPEAAEKETMRLHPPGLHPNTRTNQNVPAQPALRGQINARELNEVEANFRLDFIQKSTYLTDQVTQGNSGSFRPTYD